MLPQWMAEYFQVIFLKWQTNYVFYLGDSSIQRAIYYLMILLTVWIHLLFKKDNLLLTGTILSCYFFSCITSFWPLQPFSGILVLSRKDIINIDNTEYGSVILQMVLFCCLFIMIFFLTILLHILNIKILVIAAHRQEANQFALFAIWLTCWSGKISC